MTDFPTRFDGTLDLARLPWFERRGRELVLVDDSVGPVVDVHTHLALAFLLPQKVDLLAEHGETEHYLPVERQLDLDVYANRNFSASDLTRMKRDLGLGSLTGGGMHRTHTIANLEREMRGLRIVRSVLLAIDFPVLSDNSGAWLRASKGHDGLVVFGSVHPYRPNMERELIRQIGLGACGVKMHPAVQTVLPGDPRAMKLYALCAKYRLPVLFHCGPVDIETRLGRRLSQVRHYFRPIEKNPETTFVLGHSGALQLELALEIARRYPNVYLEISSQSLTNVRKILDQADVSRVLFGSDWPFYHQAIPLAKLLIATVGREALRPKVLHQNAARLLGLGEGALGV
ncbi:MAG: amidohydrolase family protein [Polyangiaceae bacterium]|nr:amidohydrolase family protein [Polyangiaceae bacterium]